MRNFDYLKNLELADLYNYCNTAEVTQVSDPDRSALNGRRALEWMVRSIYQMKNVEVKDRTSLYGLIEGEVFKDFVGDERVMKGIHYVRKAGNKAAHLGKVSKRESFFSLLNLYNFIGATLVKLCVITDFAPFRKELVPEQEQLHIEPKQEPIPVGEIAGMVDVNEINPGRVEVPDTGISEAETRRYFIDMMLSEAGWSVVEEQGAIVPLKACVEVEVQGMPSDSGEGRADYVLFGASGLPLAVIEAKRTSVDAEKGRHQAELYADCLEKRYGLRPVIYYTNGYKTKIIDGLGYPPREVYGYHSVEDLELLIKRRKVGKITDVRVKEEITDREYQKRAIHSVCERFNKNHRRTLLVMATGTGKTRVSISLVDVLTRSGRVKNVLFLADRTALVKQAAKNYSKLLSHMPVCILSEDKEPDMDARIMFSTYQTMINYIDCDSKDFSVGRFDLIIIDEAHRSVFGKYTTIFNYFDSLVVGLTATPRNEVDRNTFDLFNIDAEDTFAYELDEAVADGYLVPYNALKRGTLILKEGIKYEDLDEDEKKQLEKVWQYEQLQNVADPEVEYHRDIASNEIFRYIYNVDTIDKVLQDLMENGQKVQSGEVIGKTIIFANRHEHAQLIVERFSALYPEYGPDFCVLIDNYVTYAQDLINRFEVRDNLPQIAVSVDMLDTGIDVPDILNLVFFKPVHSKIKFMQMIGRGTRLSEGIFGPGKDKTHFNIYDWCNNFEYFKLNPGGKEATPTESLTERLFRLRTDIVFALQQQEYQADEFAKQFHDDLKQELCAQVAELKDSHVSVRLHWDTVVRYRNADNWTYISAIDTEQIKAELAPLVAKTQDDESAKKCDVLLLNIELSQLVPEVKAGRCVRKVIEIGQLLQERVAIPQIAKKMPLINEIVKPEFWESVTLNRLEHVRKELRELVKFLITGSTKRTFTIDIEDELVEIGEVEPFVPTTYKQRVTDYLLQNRNLPVIEKIYNLQQLSHADIKELERILWQELGSKEEYKRHIESGKMLCGENVAMFIRAQIGVDRKVALEKFSEFLSGNTLNQVQEEYLKIIITYLCKNGDITPNTIVNEAPFDTFEWIDVFGTHFISVRKYVETLHRTIIA